MVSPESFFTSLVNLLDLTFPQQNSLFLPKFLRFFNFFASPRPCRSPYLRSEAQEGWYSRKEGKRSPNLCAYSNKPAFPCQQIREKCNRTVTKQNPALTAGFPGGIMVTSRAPRQRRSARSVRNCTRTWHNRHRPGWRLSFATRNVTM